MRIKFLILAAATAFPFLAPAQTLSITNGVQIYAALTNTTVTMSGRCELRITAASSPIPGCLINLNSADAWFLLPNVKPSVVVASYLGQVRVNGLAAVADSNCRVVQYGVGAVVIPQAPAFQPLQVFSGPNFTGAALSLSQYVYYQGTGLGALNATISSFKLKRGYAATFAQNENGTGLSKCYVAQDGDLEISMLPATLDNSVRFIYVVPWRWTSKKGIAGNIATGLNVNWYYDWNLDQNSSRDLEYLPIRQSRYWPSLSQNWQTRGANTVLGYNEPDQANQANLAVGDAIYSWPDLLGTGLRVGAPAVSDGGLSWLYSFISQADAAGLRVDFVPVHYYRCYGNAADPDGATTQFYNFLKGIYDTVKRPLWVTEWNNGANWTTCADPTAAQEQATVAKMIAMLDSTPFVERYAIYNWVEDVRRVQWDDGSLTAAGVSYRDEVSPISYVQEIPNNSSRSLAQLRFETNTLDTSGFGNNGFAFGIPAYTNGPSGQAVVFDGTNNFIQLPPNIANSAAFSFAAWINWSGGANWQRIFDFGNDTTHYLFLSPSSGSGTLRFAILNGGSEQRVETTALPVGQWRHVALTLSGNTAKLYVNGALAASNTGMTIAPSAFNPAKNYLGESQFTADPLFRGAMDEVLITDYALTAAQVASLMTNTPPQFTTNFLARGSATEAQSYSNSIAGTAADSDPGDTLTYSKANGPAWLNVAADGTLTGTPTSADGGTNYFTVRVTDAAGASAFAVVAISTTVTTASGTWISDTSSAWSVSNRWSSGVVATGAGQTADFSTINITGNRTVTLDVARSIGNLKFSDTSGGQTWTITNSGGSALTLDTGTATQPSIIVTNTATLATPLAGANGFVKSGPGTLILAANNSLSGALNLDRGIDGNNNDGITRLANPDAVANLTSLNIRNTSVNTAGGATLQLDGSTGSIIISQDFGVTCRNNSTTPTIQNLAGTNAFNGNILLGTGGNMFNIQSDAGLLVFNGTNEYTGTLTGGRSYAFLGAGDHLVNGPILNSTNGAPIGLIKSGLGTLTLMATNTYTNTTTISGGTLLVNGAITASPVIVGSTATLGGDGVIKTPVSVQAGGKLSPGNSIGTLTINNTLSLAGTTFLELDPANGTNDQVRGLTTVTYGGALVLTNLSGTNDASNTFKLFSAANYNGSFASVAPAIPAPGFVWNTNTLTTDGTLRLIQTVSFVPANINFQIAGNQLTLAWPTDHIGWRLQVQTNDVSTGLGTNWMDVAGATTTNSFTLNLDSTSGAVFYQMIFP